MTAMTVMPPRKRASSLTSLLPLAGFLALAGCKQGDDLDKRIQAAEQRIADFERDLAEKDALIERVKQLQIQEARLAQQLSPPTVEAVEGAFAPLHGMRVISERADAVVVTGRAPLAAFAERLELLGTQQPGLQALEMNVDGEAIEIQLAVVQPEEAPSSRRRTPLGGVLPWNNTRREKLVALEARETELASQFPAFVLDRGQLQWRINALQGLLMSARDSRRALVVVAKALTAPAPLLTPLELRWADGKVVIGGRPTPVFKLTDFKSAPPTGLSLSETFQQENWVTSVVSLDPTLLEAPKPPEAASPATPDVEVQAAEGKP